MPIKRVRPGKCRHQFLIKKNSDASTSLTSLGRQTSTEATHATVKGEINKLTGDERIIANQTFGQCTHEFICWFVPGVKNTMWLEGLNGKRYNIVDIDNVEERNSQLYMILNSETS